MDALVKTDGVIKRETVETIRVSDSSKCEDQFFNAYRTVGLIKPDGTADDAWPDLTNPDYVTDGADNSAQEKRLLEW